MEEKYLVIYNCDEGICIDHWTKRELLKNISEDERENYFPYGSLVFLDSFPGMTGNYLNVPRDRKNTYICVIKCGDVVVPTAKEIITQYEIK